MKKIRLALTIIMVLTLPNTHGVSLDQRDPNYQRSIHELSLGQKYLIRAIEHLRNSDLYYPQPGVFVARDISILEQQVQKYQLILAPETKRQETIELVPDLFTR